MTATDWRSTMFAVVDVETTGLDPARHEVLSIGIVDVVDGRVRVSSSFYREVRPATPPTADTVVIHGIRPSDANRGLDPAAVGEEVVHRLAGRVVVAHVARIERGFLSPWLEPLGWSFPRRVVDTDVLTRVHLVRRGRPALQEHVGLGAAASLFGLPEQRRHHALGDALTTAQLLLALAGCWPGGAPSLEDLLSADRGLPRRRLVGGFRRQNR
jgi:DNA polymerase-3 subunit epsilon